MNTPDQWTDKEVKEAFLKMVVSIALWVVWFLFTVFWGLIKDFAFFDDPHIAWWQHALFYLWFASTLPVVVWITLVKIWRIKR